jgi:hypothetical protein
LEELSHEAQQAADRNDSKNLYRIVRELTNSRHNSGVPIKSKDGHVLLTEEEQSKRWVEHFQGVLNQPEPSILFNFDHEPPVAPLDVTMQEFSLSEIEKAIRSLKNNKAAGLDEVSAELLKHGRDIVSTELLHLFNLIWQKEEVPEDWRNGVIVTLPKKGNLSDCDNWRGITLLSVPGKAFCSALLNRLKETVDITLREEQAGFRRGRSFCEQIFTLRNIIEQSQEFQSPLFLNYIDFLRRPLIAFIASLYGKL